MFSYLRPAGRRTATLPPDPPAAWLDDAQPSSSEEPGPNIRPAPETETPSPVLRVPPSLPPIPRVASQYEPLDNVPYIHAVGQDGQEQAWRRRESRRGQGSQHRHDRAAAPRQQTSHQDQSHVNHEGPRGLRQHSVVPEACQHEGHGTTQVQRARKYPALQDPTDAGRAPSHLSKQRPPTPPQPLRAPPAPPAPSHLPPTPPQPSRAPPPPPPPPLSAPPVPLSQVPSFPMSEARAAPPAAPKAASLRASKPKLHRLNPMSLLARRRASQHADSEAADASSFRQAVLNGKSRPDDYDPRIRGKGVHDFSEPRPAYGSLPGGSAAAVARKTRLTLQTGSSDGLGGARPATSDPALENLTPHTPVFKEHFGDDIDDFRFDGDDPRNKDSTGIAGRVPASSAEKAPSPLPPFANKLPSDVADPMRYGTAPLRPAPRSPPAPEKEVQIGARDSAQATAEPSAHPTPSKSDSQPSSTNATPFQPAGLPKHLKSNASRFSFDFGGVGSAAQEKLLEDRHRERAAQRTRASTASALSIAETENEDTGYDDLDFDDGLEERIPGVNADEADDGDGFGEAGMVSDSVLAANEGGFDDDPASLSVNGTPPPEGYTYETPPPTVPQLYRLGNINLQSAPLANGLGIVAQAKPSPADALIQPRATSPTPPDDDDLYFDDGVIDAADLQVSETVYDDGTIDLGGDAPAAAFDESVFDDDTNAVFGLPLRDRALLSGAAVSGSRIESGPAPALVPASLPAPDSPSSSPRSTRHTSVESGALAPGGQAATADTSRASLQPAEAPGIAARQPSLAKPHGFSLAPTGRGAADELTQGNLFAYHDALALAATRAAQEGRFERRPSTADGTAPGAGGGGGGRQRVSFKDDVDGDSTAAALAGYDACLDVESMPPAAGVPDFDDEDAAEDDDDDAIIAAANAEALENDDEGFYGREFGFYAQGSSGPGGPGSEGSAEYANGGYFGAPPGAGVRRSHSGRANGQEPSLTPITERSEWSQRNSTISLAAAGGVVGAAAVAAQAQAVAQAQPGLAQIADALQLEDEAGLALPAFLKLRRGPAAAPGEAGVGLPSGGPPAGIPPTGFKAAPAPFAFPPLPMDPPPPLPPPSSAHASVPSPPRTAPAGANGSFDPDRTPVPPQRGLSLQTADLTPVPPAPRSAGLANGGGGSGPGGGPGGSDGSPIRRSHAVRASTASAGSAAGAAAGGAGASRGHSRTSSGAESVSYVREPDEEGGRWVVERRRTGEGGVVEVLGREVLPVGRI